MNDEAQPQPSVHLPNLSAWLSLMPLKHHPSQIPSLGSGAMDIPSKLAKPRG